MTNNTARALEAELDELSREVDDLLTYGPAHVLKTSRSFAAQMVTEHEQGIFWEITALRAMEEWQ